MDNNAPPEARLGFLLYRAGLAVARGYERALAPLGVAPAEAGLLAALGYQGPGHVRGLGRLLGLSRQTVVNMTRRLEEAALVQRQPAPEDARLALFAITVAGRARLGEIEAISSRFDAELAAVVDPAAEPVLAEQLRRVLAAGFLAHEA